ncbi:MAG: hypothetical protein WC851_05770 [Candidatus Shapirobacteria bacterium]
MKKEETIHECCSHDVLKRHHHSHGGNSNPIYGLGVLGSLFYFLSHAASFSDVMVGIFKSVFWPAYFMYQFLSSYQF